MPLGAFISSKHHMSTLMQNPELGHLTTFGGHPVSCAAALATLKVLLHSDYVSQAVQKASRFITRLQHPIVREIRHAGLMMAVELQPEISLPEILHAAFEQGILSDFFMFDPHSFRIAPPLIISDEEIDDVCDTLTDIFDKYYQG